jgi:hypothetical protein
LLYQKGDQNHLYLLKNLVSSNIKTHDRIGVVWFYAISLIWKTRNDMVFNQIGFDWDKLMEECVGKNAFF